MRRLRGVLFNFDDGFSRSCSQSPDDWLRYLGVEITYEENTRAHNSAQIFIELDNADESYALSLKQIATVFFRELLLR